MCKTHPCQKGPDLRRDYDSKNICRNRLIFRVRKDLIYEGITTQCSKSILRRFCIVRKDLIYEGITTFNLQVLTCRLSGKVRKDLIYEGITTGAVF